MRSNVFTVLAAALLAAPALASPTPEVQALQERSAIEKRSFWATCDNCYTSGSFLACNCRNANGDNGHTTLDLNRCLVNSDGSLQWRSNGGYSSSCDLSNPNNGALPTYVVNCRNGRGQMVVNNFNLDANIHNGNGILGCNI